MSWDKVESDVNSGPLGLIKWIIVLIVFICLLSAAIYAVKTSGKMAIDRVAVKNSLQYQEGKAAQAAIFRANIADLEAQIRREEDADIRQQLIDQKRVIQIQLNAITINQ